MDLTPGAEIPPFSRRADFDAWNRYAAVNDEFVPLHMDDAAGRAAGFDAAIGMGNLALAYLHCLLRDWAGEGARVRRIEVAYRQPALRGSTVAARGRIVAVSEGEDGAVVELELWVSDEAGRVLIDGRGVVAGVRR